MVLTLTPLQIMVCVLTGFTIGLYVGSFIQRRRDSAEIMLLKVTLRKLSDTFIDSNEKKEEKK